MKGTCQLPRFVPQGKLLVYNTLSLLASPPTEVIIAKSISLSRVRIEDNTLQIGSFVACTYDEKWWLWMVAQVSDEFGDRNINFMHPSGLGKQFHWPTKSVSLKPQFCLLIYRKILLQNIKNTKTIYRNNSTPPPIT